jgi:hypothetical protein
MTRKLGVLLILACLLVAPSLATAKGPVVSGPRNLSAAGSNPDMTEGGVPWTVYWETLLLVSW